MEKLELKHLSPYLPYGFKIRLNNGEIHEMALCGDGVILCTDIRGSLGNMWPIYFDDFKPLVIPLRQLTKEKFKEMCQAAFGWKEAYCAEINGFWAVYEKEPLDEEDIEIRGHWSDIDFIMDAEEADFDNVVSIRKVNPKAVFQFDVALGCSDEMRYFADFNIVESLHQQLFANHFDVFDLIGKGLALNKLDILK